MKDLCLATRLSLLHLVEMENLRQLEKWGVQDHEPSEWLMYATEELGECANAIGEFQHRGGLVENVVREAIQTATLMLKIAEMFQDLLITKEKK